MGIYIIRGVFALIFAGAGWQAGVFLNGESLVHYWNAAGVTPPPVDWCIITSVGLYLVLLAFEVGFGKVSISTISAVLFGLIAGFIVANLVHGVTSLLLTAPQIAAFGAVIKLGLVCIFCYLGVATIYKTRDRFNFIIPYVEFQREEQGPRPFLLDTSSIIDGRIADISETQVIDVPIIIPRFVLAELQAVADSQDRLRRVRGRRGLDVLNRLQNSPQISIEINDDPVENGVPVDRQLVETAKRIHARIVTNDSPLEKIAQLEGVDVLNINDLANALRPVVIPGEEIELDLMKRGEELGQAVGYLQDGTMVVVSDAVSSIGSKVSVTVTSVLQRSSGRIIFGRLESSGRKAASAT